MALEFLVAFCTVVLVVSADINIILHELADETSCRYHTNGLTGHETGYTGNQTKPLESIPVCLPIRRQTLDT